MGRSGAGVLRARDKGGSVPDGLQGAEDGRHVPEGRRDTEQRDSRL